MNINLHKNATAMPKIRQAIQPVGRVERSDPPSVL